MSRYRSRVREVVNRNTVVSLALEQGFSAFLPVYDGGVDVILYHESDSELRKVQLKSRWTIDRKYMGRDIWVFGLTAPPIHDRVPQLGSANVHPTVLRRNNIACSSRALRT
jgi:hypothetical protein